MYKYIFLQYSLLFSIWIFSNAYTYGQVFDWSLGAGGWTDDNAKSVSVDKDGNVYNVGYLTNGTIGDTTLRDDGAYVAKISAEGKLIWAKSFGTFDTSGTDVVIDSQGNVFLLGIYTHGFMVDGHGLNSTTVPKIFLMKIDSEGVIHWLKNFVSPYGNGRSYGWGIAIDHLDYIYLGGHYNTAIQLGDSVHHVRGREGFDHDMLLMKLDNDGNVIWARTPGSQSEEYIYDLAVDRQGIYFVGFLSGRTIEFEDTVFHSPISELGFIAKYSLDGDYQWAEVFHSPNYSKAFSVAVDEKGDVYTSGIWSVRQYIHRVDKFLAKLSADGQLLFTRFIESGPAYTLESGIATSGNNVYFTSGLSAPYKAGPLRNDANSTQHATILKYNEIGYPQWIKLTKGADNDTGIALAVDKNDLYLAGNYTSDTLYLDGSFITNNSGNRDTDFFLAKAMDTTANICPDPASFVMSHESSFCTGDSIRLLIENPYAVYIEWYRDGQKLHFDNQKSIYVMKEGIYSAAINSNTRCPVYLDGIRVDLASNRTDSTDIIIFSKPEKVFNYDSVHVCLGEELVLEVEDNPQYKYQWRNLHLIDTERNKATIITNQADTSLIILQIQDTLNSCIINDTLRLVSIGPPLLTLKFTGDSLIASGGFAYEWYLDGNQINELNGRSSIFPEITGSYTVHAANEAGCYSKSNSVLIEVALGIEETTDDICVYPVPFDSHIFIDCIHPPEKTILINTEGIIVKKFDSGNVLDMSDIKPGTYILKIHTRNRLKAYKIIK